MFDIGFSEMMLIAVVALVVLGPDRLPKVAKQAGQWMGKMRRYVDDVKTDINRQMELDELRKLQAEVKDAASTLQTSMTSAVNDAQSELNSISSTVTTAADASGSDAAPITDWDKVYAVRRQREKLKDRRREADKELGRKRPKKY
jgi:sec-independent protein translocase protein TatB